MISASKPRVSRSEAASSKAPLRIGRIVGAGCVAIGSIRQNAKRIAEGREIELDKALFNNTISSNNTATGVGGLQNNIALGDSAGVNLTTGNSNIEIGNTGIAGESKTIRIGTRGTQRNTFIAGISGVTVANGVGVIIDNKLHLGTVVSSARFKDQIITRSVSLVSISASVGTEPLCRKGPVAQMPLSGRALYLFEKEVGWFPESL